MCVTCGILLSNIECSGKFGLLKINGAKITTDKKPDTSHGDGGVDFMSAFAIEDGPVYCAEHCKGPMHAAYHKRR